MQVSDYIANFLASRQIYHVFGLSGGASLHLLHSIRKHAQLRLVCCHHEQSAAMAADGYARVTHKPSAVITTSGPGATNLITGIATSYYDSIPVLFITGQVSTFRSSQGSPLRQYGFQETPIVDIASPIVKRSYYIKSVSELPSILNDAYKTMLSGRMGPVLIDIPDNLQRESISQPLPSFSTPTKNPSSSIDLTKLQSRLAASSSPILLIGWGVELTASTSRLINLATKLGIPVVCTWGARNVINSHHPLFAGIIGTHSDRAANIILKDADLLIALGTRLDTKATGSPASHFAPNAYKVVFDIDPHELSKYERLGINVELPITADLACLDTWNALFSINAPASCTFLDWRNYISKLIQHCQKYDSKPISSRNSVGPNSFFKAISVSTHSPLNIMVDTGCAIAWAMKYIDRNHNLTIYHDNNNTAMGWSIPALLGAYLAFPNRFHVAIVGDGSFMFTLSELATLKSQGVAATIFVLNNQGYSMIKQTQDQWLNSQYVASDSPSDMTFPTYRLIAEAFGLAYTCLSSSAELHEIPSLLFTNVLTLVEVIINPNERVFPIVRYGSANYDMEPSIPYFPCFSSWRTSSLPI